MPDRFEGKLVSIGMPVLNAEATIARALTDLMAQSYRNLEIVVCDNASTDHTAEIAESFAVRDDRIKVIRFTEKVDIRGSFERAFNAGSGTYFMFAPADDRWYPQCVERLIAILEDDATLAACSGRVAFTDGNVFVGISTGTRPLAGSHRQRLRSYFADPAENARAFGLYRRAALDGAFPPQWYPGWDFQLIARTLAHGGHAEVPAVLAERDRTALEKYIAEFDRYYGGKWGRWLPLGPPAVAVWRDRSTPFDPGLLWNLAVFTLRSHILYAALRTRRWGVFIQRVADLVHLARWAIDRPAAPGPGLYVPSATNSGASPRSARSRRISSR